MNILVLLLLTTITWCFSAVHAAPMDRYAQNQIVYMFPDDVINASRQGCNDSQPVKQSKFFSPGQQQQNYKSQPYQSTNKVSRNVAYVSDFYGNRAVNSSSVRYYDPTFSNPEQAVIAQKYVQNNNFDNRDQVAPAFQTNSRVPSGLMYISDFEPKKYSNTLYNNSYNNPYNRDGLFAHKENIRYVPVPVYVYKNDLLSNNNNYNYSRNTFYRQNSGLESYSDINDYNLNNTDFINSDYSKSSLNHNIFSMVDDFPGKAGNPFAINPIKESGLFSLPGSNHVLDKYTTFSSNNELYNSSDFLKSNLSGFGIFPDLMLNP
ncbi:MAG: hypothetical protein KZQ83_15990 [gamma proteobacterium symbiont of Taylorina sp.]|nr:hypothetical protein [gamma proteobacterium symbiont of Taylorina sp.]